MKIHPNQTTRLLTVAKHGHSLYVFSSLKLPIETHRATIAIKKAPTPMLPKYATPSPFSKKDWYITYIPNTKDSNANKKPTIPFFECTLSANRKKLEFLLFFLLIRTSPKSVCYAKTTIS